ncbi:MAG: GNAT family N-acetyltransferase [Defluviitaleaceae bacterium]|nr:GNAT family N-acetyltransferase [Defluviitaleaceae bacterium]
MLRQQWVKGAGKLADVHEIRQVVFMDEQKVPFEEEMIPWEDEISLHLIVYDGDIPAATGRIFMKDDKFVLQRIAVMKDYRGRGLGKLITKELIKKCLEMGANEITLSSQSHAITFYEQFGFVGYTDEYMDAGIPHVSMRYTKIK